MIRLVSIDPGMSTGLFVGEYSETEPLVKLDSYQIADGLPGLHLFLEDSGILDSKYRTVQVISERFTPRPMRRAYKSEELEPLRIEGYLMAKGYMPYDYKDIRWGRPERMVIAGGSTTAQRKKNGDDKLREMGLWTLPTEVGRADNFDVIASTKHAVGYLLQIMHQPTMNLFKDHHEV